MYAVLNGLAAVAWLSIVTAAPATLIKRGPNPKVS